MEESDSCLNHSKWIKCFAWQDTNSFGISNTSKHSERSDECCTSVLALLGRVRARIFSLQSKLPPNLLLYGFSIFCCYRLLTAVLPNYAVYIIYFSHQERFRLFRWSDIVHRCIISQFLGRSIKFIRVRLNYFMRGQVSPCETKLSRVRPSFQCKAN